MSDPACTLCQPEDVVVENELAYAARDKFPLAAGHVIVMSASTSVPPRASHACMCMST